MSELEDLLTSAGAQVMYRQPFLHHGYIDHLVVGPGGVTIIDSRRWRGRVSVRDGAPRVGFRTKPGELAKLVAQRDGVRLALGHARPELRNVSVRAVMCLVEEPLRRVSELNEGLVLAGAQGAARIAVRGGRLTEAEIAEVASVLRRRLPEGASDDIDVTEAMSPPTPARGDPGSPSGVRARPPRRRVSCPAGLLPVLLAAGLVLLLAVQMVQHRPSTNATRHSITASRSTRQPVSLMAPTARTVAWTISAGPTGHAVRAAVTRSEQHPHLR